MNKIVTRKATVVLGMVGVLLLLCGIPVHATIDGVTGTNFHLTAKEDYITTSDGDSFLMWSYANGKGRMQYPGPTLIVNQGDQITVHLTNKLPNVAGNVSIVFLGQEVTASGGVPGLITREAPKGGKVNYRFTATEPGTYLYHSGTRPDLQVEMGLVGALIVRPKNFDPAAPRAYNHASSAYEREYLFLLTEMDPVIHQAVQFRQMDKVDTTKHFPVNWFINGRNFPDNMAQPNVAWLPTQPYNISPMMHPGERVLCRVIGAGRDLHPYHFHGNNLWMIAKDGRLLQSAPGAGADVAVSDYTMSSVPGQTYDAIFSWTGAIGWDIYGHAPGDPMEKNEDPADHGKPLPLILPTRDDVNFGAFYSGSPFLGSKDTLPPDHPGLNVGGGFFYMWHSHSEKELTSNNLFPGGMLTFMNIVPWSIPIP